MAGKIRVVVAKPGLDGHDRGAKIIARALRDAGMEVIYTGLHQTPEQIAETVIQEDADAVGLSILSGAHMTLVPRVVELLKAQGVDDVLVTVGGTIPADDIPELKELGVAAVFTPGSGTDEIVDFMVSRYGDFVLYRPPLKASTWLLWFGPPLVLLVGFVMLMRTVRERRKRIEREPLTASEHAEAELLLGSKTEDERK